MLTRGARILGPTSQWHHPHAASFRSRLPNPLAFDDANCKCLLVQGYSDTNGTGRCVQAKPTCGARQRLLFPWSHMSASSLGIPSGSDGVINKRAGGCACAGRAEKIWVDPVSSQNLCIPPLDGGHVDRRQIIRSSCDSVKRLSTLF